MLFLIVISRTHKEINRNQSVIFDITQLKLKFLHIIKSTQISLGRFYLTIIEPLQFF